MMRFSLVTRNFARFARPGILVCAALLLGNVAHSQRPPQIAQPAAPAGETDQQPKMMQLTLPDNVTLNVLADLTSVRLGIKIIYDEEIRQQKISIKGHAEQDTQHSPDLQTFKPADFSI